MTAFEKYLIANEPPNGWRSYDEARRLYEEEQRICVDLGDDGECPWWPICETK